MNKLVLVVLQAMAFASLFAEEPIELSLSFEGEDAYLTIKNISDDTIFIGDPTRSQLPMTLSSVSLSKGIVLNEKRELNDHFKFLVALSGSSTRNTEMTIFRFKIPDFDADDIRGANLTFRLWVATAEDIKDGGILALRPRTLRVSDSLPGKQ